MDAPKRAQKTGSGRLPAAGGKSGARRAGGVEAVSPSSSGRGEAAEGRLNPSLASPRDEDAGDVAAAPTPAKGTTKRLPAVRGGPRREQTGSHKAVSAKGPSSASRRVRVEDDLDDAPREFKRGLPLAAKIAIFTALLVAALMVGLGSRLFEISAKEIDAQINQKGVAAAHAYSSLIDPLCFTEGGPDAENPRDGAIAKWQKKLEAFVSGRESMFLNIMYTKDEKGATLIANDAGVQLAAVPPAGDSFDARPRATIDGVEMSEGDYQSARFQGRVRRYVEKVSAVFVESAPEDAGGGKKPGGGGLLGGGRGTGPAHPPVKPHDAWAHVFIKAAEIDRVHEENLGKLEVAVGLGIAIAVVCSILVAAFLAAPLRALLGDMRAVAAGNLDHVTTPRSRDEIGMVAAQFNEMTRSLEAAQRLEQERQAIESELVIATEIQTKLLPERIPQIAGFDLFSFYLSAKEVGGDYYDFLVIDPTHLGIVVADVSGKGVPGAMVMTMVRSLLRLASHRETSPGETLKKVNRILAKDIRRGMFVTAVYAVLDVQKKTMTVASAGHNPVMYFSAKTGEVRPVSPSGIALGFDKGRTFDENIKEETIALAPGDRCVFYTDGVVEAMSDEHQEFGLESFQALVKDHAARSSKDFTNSVVEALEAHRGEAKQSDDITITTLKVE